MPERTRLLSLDVFRGLTIAGMIVVNSPGNSKSYAQLDHAPWNGCTLTDLISPFFLFIVGAAIVFSLRRRIEEGARPGALITPIARRAAVILALGLFLNSIPHYHLAAYRVPGVLQRIAVCYFVCALLFLYISARAQAVLGGAVLVAYWLAMTRWPVPGFGAGVLTPEGSLASFLDQRIWGPAHSYRHAAFDPEGFLSTFPAVVTTLLGIQAGLLLRSPRAAQSRCLVLAATGAACAAAGWLWGLRFPLNKALWTSSYVLWTGGLACLLLAAAYWVLDVRGWKAWSKPFEVLGVNAIAAYVLHALSLKALVYLRMTVGGNSVSPRDFLCGSLFGTWLSPLNASLAFAVSHAVLWIVVLWGFYRKRIFLRA